jgi:plastocyanin
MRTPGWIPLLVAAGLAALPAHAGQVRIDVGPGTVFVPSNITLNLGDHMVWVWKGNGHTVTSGNDGSVAGDGIFNSSPTGTLYDANSSFAWKSDRTIGSLYYCVPHWPGMVATFTVQPSGIAVSSFRITEVRYNSATADSNFIEICNLGAAAGDLGRYRVSVQSGSGTVTLPLNDIEVPAGTCIRVHPGATGTNTATRFYFPTMPALTATGSAGLYVPNSIFPSLADDRMMADFVQWGAGAQPNEATAATATLWTAGEFVPGVGPFHSLEFCGTADQHGKSFWAEIAAPTPGAKGNCATPALPSSWGRLKTRYR